MTRFETRPADWLTVAEASRRILAKVSPLPRVRVPLAGALGHALAVPLRASVTLPPWDNSAMDGYAVRSADLAGAGPETPRTLSVIGEIRCGTQPDRAVGPGQAVRIMTGAPVPPGADSVVRVEDTDAEAVPGTVVVRDARDSLRNVRPAGEDMREGDEVLPAGTRIGPGQVAVLASLGMGEVAVRRPPRVALLSNGDELAPLERFQEVREGRSIPETNGQTLAAAVRELGGEPLHLGIARDNEASVQAHLVAATESDADVLVTVAGASMGEADLFKRVLDRMGFTLEFWRVRMRPGSPVSFGFLERRGADALPVFGLPGNPASAFVTFHVLVRPYLLAMAGHTGLHAPSVTARTRSPLGGPADLERYFRVRLTGSGSDLEAELTGPQGSGLVRSLGLAHGLAVVPEGVEDVEKGRPVRVMLLQPGAGWDEDPDGLRRRE